MEGFYRPKEGGTRKFLEKEEKELFKARSSSFVGLGMTEYHANYYTLLTRKFKIVYIPGRG